MHQCFTCFPPPRCDWRRLMEPFYPLLVCSNTEKEETEPRHISIDFYRAAFSVTDVSDHESSRKHRPSADVLKRLCLQARRLFCAELTASQK